MTNEAAPILHEYSNRKVLAKLGYQFPIEKIEDFEVEAFTLIASELSKHESDDIKKRSRSRK